MKAPKRYGYADLIAYTLYSIHDINNEEPKSFKDSANCQQKKEWMRK